MKTYLWAVLIVAAPAVGAAFAEEGKVLYVTHEPGEYHDYTTQLKIFKEQIAGGQDWEVTVLSGSYDGLLEKMHDPDFAKGYDAIVYNYCFAESTDLDSCANVIKQTREHGIPAMLIHCSMHSWWGTFKRGEKIKVGSEDHPTALARPVQVQEWKDAHGDDPFPIYGDFTGVASGEHGPKLPISLHKLREHPAIARLPEGHTTPTGELYDNIYLVDDVVPLVEGTQQDVKSIVMWTCPQGASQVLGLTLGHSNEEFEGEVFQNLVTDSVNYLLKDPKP